MGADTRNGEPGPPRHRLPTIPKPPNAPLDNPLPCETRDMAPISENPCFRAKEGAGESNLTRLEEREGEPESLRQRREGDDRAGERAGLKRRRRGPERLEATSTKAC